MTISTKLDKKLEGVDNHRALKYRVMLTLEEDEDKTKASFSFSLSPPTVIAHLVHEAYELGFHPRIVHSVL